MQKQILTAHEHLGNGTLFFSNGTAAEYNSEIQTLTFDLELLSAQTGRKVTGVVLYPQMPYLRYSRPGDYDVSTDQINRSFFAMVDRWKAPFAKYPFLYLRVKDPLSVNRGLLERYRGRCSGIKLHLDAESADAGLLLSSGVLALAQEFHLPITVHGSRPGGMLDFPKIRDSLFGEISRRQIRLNIAHASFLHPKATTDQIPDTVYFDLSPLGIILDQYLLQNKSQAELFDALFNIFENHPTAVMYGGDYPYNRQVWEDGSCHGLDRKKELTLLQEFLTSVTEEQKDAFYCRNAQAFLGL